MTMTPLVFPLLLATVIWARGVHAEGTPSATQPIGDTDAVNAAATMDATTVWRKAERQRLEAEMAAANERYPKEADACYEKFAVNACRDAVQLQHSRLLDRIKAELNNLQQQERLEAAQIRERRIAEKKRAKSDGEDSTIDAAVKSEPAKAKKTDRKFGAKQETRLDTSAQKEAQYQQKQKALEERRKARDLRIKSLAAKEVPQ